MHFVEVNALYCTGLAVGKDHGLADELSLGLLELAEDRCLAFETCGSRGQRAAKVGRWNRVPRDQKIGSRAEMSVYREGRYALLHARRA